jgi:hypothetical protein
VTGLAAELLTNSGFNHPFVDIPGRIWHSQNEKIAGGWLPFYIPDNTYEGDEDASKLHWMSSSQFAAAFGGLDYHIEGNQAQVMWSSYDFDAGVYQQINGVTPGLAYGFDIAMVTFWRGTGYPDSDGVMLKQIGIDPYGGTDPASSNIIWGPTNGNDKAWVYMDLAATAQAGAITVFAKIQAPENDSFNHTDLDLVFFEAAHVALAPTAALNVSNNGATINANWSGVAAPDWSIKGYEVQYKDQAASAWTTLQPKNQNTTHKSFTGQIGHTYIVRMRAWQTRAESYNSDIDMPGVWVEQSVTIGNAVTGQVLNHMGIGWSGVTVSIDGGGSTISDSGGQYVIPTGGPGTFSVAAADFNGLIAPPPVSVSVPANGIGIVNITLRPAGTGQGIGNNDFEENLDAWDITGAAGISTADRHSGQGSLLITDAAEVSQTNPVTDMDKPLLSFWYKSDANFTVDFVDGVGPVTTRMLNASVDWAHIRLESGLGNDYSGPVGVQFSYNGEPANIYIDEVSIAAGPEKIFLPIVKGK